MEDKIAEKSMDYGGLGREVSERNKESIKKWAKSNFHDILARILTVFCTIPEKLRLNINVNELICLVEKNSR